MEFHLPYMALRRERVADPRKLRMTYEMLETLEMEAGRAPNDSFYYQAQISFLVTGVDEWQWTAYCCVDRFFGSERNPDWYLNRQLDGLPAGGRAEFFPIWDPREYFLFVCARRFSQVTKEWSNAILKLESRLDEYVRDFGGITAPSVRLIQAQEAVYEKELRTDQFSEDKDFRKSTRYIRALSILRRFHNLLLKTLEAWEGFSSGGLKYFDTNSEILDRLWDRYYESLFSDASELLHLERSLLQRIQTFDRMKDGVLLITPNVRIVLMANDTTACQRICASRTSKCYQARTRHWCSNEHDCREYEEIMRQKAMLTLA
jgi:hypothetical protein